MTIVIDFILLVFLNILFPTFGNFFFSPFRFFSQSIKSALIHCLKYPSNEEKTKRHANMHNGFFILLSQLLKVW